MKVTVHSEAIEALRPEWEELFSVDREATPFGSPAWIFPWLGCWAPASARPWIIVVRRHGELVGVAPLLIRRRGPVRVMRGLGRAPGDYWDIVALPNERRAVAGAVAEEIARRAGEWDVLTLDSLRSEALKEAFECTDLKFLDEAPRVHPQLTLPPTFDGYLSTLSGARRNNLLRHLRRLDRGDLDLRRVDDQDDLPDAIQRWHELRTRWWMDRGRNLSSMHRSERFREFTRNVLEQLVPAGLAGVWELRCAGESIGVSINFVDQETFYWFLSGFDPSMASIGPGKIIIGATIRESIAAGRRNYDFMLGSEPYKYWFGARDEVCDRFTVLAGRRRGRAAVYVRSLSNRIRSGKQSEQMVSDPGQGR